MPDLPRESTFTFRSQGGYSYYFLTGCTDRGLVNPYRFLRIFVPQKVAGLTFSSNFRKSGPTSKGFLPQKWLILQLFRNFCEMETIFIYLFIFFFC